ncbi:uracil-DNA glycosylase [Salinibacterium sp. ZJ450]|uniref:uracil-DNA glycosylase n=1 Tax=Salinibacterium sp. ZJ450 TaxID=2708338 RepID=UPI00141E6167|nr:uracil-DNA glycosylase [Salinibacterium sp. ZJ450]
MTDRPLSELVDPSWVDALQPVVGRLQEMQQFLRAEDVAGRGYLPAREHVLRAFQSSFPDVRVVIIGQDPYPTPGHPIGLPFAVERAVRPLPRSLNNIYRELSDDMGLSAPEHGDLSAWSKHGILLLNRTLTVQPGLAGSHRRKGWEAITEQAVRALVARRQPLVAILWGRDAQGLTALFGDTPVIASAHPSPLSARTGFFGSRPFSRANALLEAQGAPPVDWALEH